MMLKRLFFIKYIFPSIQFIWIVKWKAKAKKMETLNLRGKAKRKGKGKGKQNKNKSCFFRVSFNWQFIQDVVRHFIENLWWTRKRKKEKNNFKMFNSFKCKRKRWIVFDWISFLSLFKDCFHPRQYSCTYSFL